MAGHLPGVAVQILRMEPKAISIHCLDHSLNLCLQDCAAQSKPFREGLSAANELHNLIKLSPKHLAIFQYLQKESSSPRLPSIKPLCPTRWTVRTFAVDSVLRNFFEQFCNYFGLKMCHQVFSATEQLATTLQGKTITAEVSIQARDATMAYLQRQI